VDLPMYQSQELGKIVKKARRDARRVNVGLIYERYPPVWDFEGDRPERKEELAPFFEEITAMLDMNEQVEPLLEDYHARMDKMIESLGGRSINLSSAWRFITGLGAPHPTETGFKWERNIGVPYLPGSSIKGAMKAWIRISEKEDEFPTMFDKESVDPVILFDAYPTSKPDLDVDILNVHYKKYYEGDAPPADYLSPTPVFFLAVAPRTEFRFRIAPRDPECDLERIEELLQRTAAELGFGAKTSAGYGQFVSM
jgi:CRISPR-associated protein Cmr6